MLQSVGVWFVKITLMLMLFYIAVMMNVVVHGQPINLILGNMIRCAFVVLCYALIF